MPADLTMSQFTYVIRKRIKLSSDQSIYIFVNNTMPSASALMSQVYKENADEDGFLYITYSAESSFGKQE